MYSSSSHLLNVKPSKCCIMSLFSFRNYCLTAAALSLPLVAEYCMTPRLHSPSPLFVTVMASYFVILDLSSPDIDLTCLFSLSNLSFLSSCMHLLHSSVPFSHPHLSSSARLYQGLGKLCYMSTGCLLNLSYMYVHDL